MRRPSSREFPYPRPALSVIGVPRNIRQVERRGSGAVARGTQRYGPEFGAALVSSRARFSASFDAVARLLGMSCCRRGSGRCWSACGASPVRWWWNSRPNHSSRASSEAWWQWNCVWHVLEGVGRANAVRFRLGCPSTSSRSWHRDRLEFAKTGVLLVPDPLSRDTGDLARAATGRVGVPNDLLPEGKNGRCLSVTARPCTDQPARQTRFASTARDGRIPRSRSPFPKIHGVWGLRQAPGRAA